MDESGRGRERIRYYLVVERPDGSTTTLPVTRTLTIGRTDDADLCLDDEFVSQPHCLLSLVGGRLSLLDQNSTNGTFVNERKVKQARLRPGDVIEIGRTRIAVKGGTGSFPALEPGPVAGQDDPMSTTPPLGMPWHDEPLRVIYKLGALLATSVDTSAAARAVLDLVFEAIPVQRGFVVLAGEGEEHPKVFASASREGEPVESEPSRTVVDQVLRTGKALHSLDVPEDLSLATSDSLRLEATRVVICAPLRHGEELIGLLYADSTVGTISPSEEMLGLFEGIADQAALALGRARLHADLAAQHEVLRQRSDQIDELNRTLERRVLGKTAQLEESRIELAMRLTELEHLQQARESMARGLVHDIRNLVGVVNSNLDFVTSTVSDDPNVAEAARDAVAATDRILWMAEDVLTTSQMEDGAYILSAEQLDVSTLLSSAVRQHAAHAKDRGVDLAADEPEQGIAVFGDRKLLERLLDNLIGNALRYADRDGRVHLSATLAGPRVELVVSDTGPGVPADDRERIFAEWYQSSGASARHHGLGLHLCQLAAEAHGGSIRVEGEAGENKFVVTLPVTRGLAVPVTRQHTARVEVGNIRQTRPFRARSPSPLPQVPGKLKPPEDGEPEPPEGASE